MKNRAISENLLYSLRICRKLKLNELLELAMLVGKDKPTECQNTWATAIAAIMKTKYSSSEEKMLMMN